MASSTTGTAPPDIATLLSLGDAPGADTTWLNAVIAHHAGVAPGSTGTLTASSIDALVKPLAELEMKVTLTIEDVQAALEEASATALHRVPRAVSEITQMRDDGAALKEAIAHAGGQLAAAEASSAAACEVLSSVDAVKVRMEEARDTLAEAASLSDVLASADEVFANGHLNDMARTVAQLRQGLTKVGTVPMFAHAEEKVRRLEGRLLSSLQAPLEEALGSRRLGAVDDLANVLGAAGKPEALADAYVASRTALLAAEWKAFESKDSKDFVAFVGTFCENASKLIEREAGWLHGNQTSSSAAAKRLFPSALLASVKNFFDKNGDTFSARAAAAAAEAEAGAATSGGGGGALETLAKLMHHSESLAACTRRAVGDAAPELGECLTAIFAPMERHVARYGALESGRLERELSSLAPRASDASTGELADLDAASRRVSTSLAPAFASLSSASKRCASLTGGTGMAELHSASDTSLASYADALTAFLIALRELESSREVSARAPSASASASAAPPSEAASAGDAAGSAQQPVGEEARMGGAIALLVSAAELTSRARALETSLRVAASSGEDAARLRTVLKYAAAESPSGSLPNFTAPALRLVADADRAKRLQDLVESAEGAPAAFLALPRAHRACASFHDTAHSLVLEAMLARVRTRLAGVRNLDVWKRESGGEELFSSYPQEFATEVGEYLLTLPQLLEQLEDESEEWITRVALGAAKLLQKEVLGIREMSTAGGAQLGVDVEYILNVLAALGVDLPAAVDLEAALAQAKAKAGAGGAE